MSPAPRLADVVARVRLRLERGAAVAAVLWILVAATLVLLVAWLLVGSDGWTQGTRVPLILDLLLLVAAGGGVWTLLRLRRFWLTERRLATSMEGAAELGPGMILGSLELGRALPAGVSPSLVALGEQGVVRRLDLPEERLAGSLGGEISLWSRRARNGLTVLVPLAVAAAVLAPERSLAAMRGLGAPVRLAAAPVLAPIEVAPGDVEVLRGSDVRVLVDAPGRDSVRLHWQAEGDVVRTATAPAGGRPATFVMRGVRASVRYWASATDGSRSATYRVTPVDPLFVSDIALELAFPSHTGRPPEEYRGDTPPLTVPVGTRFEIRGRASRDLLRAALERGPEPGTSPCDAASAGCDGMETAAELEVDGSAFSALWVPRRGGTFHWRFTDSAGAAAEVAPGPLELTLVPDSAPEVRFTFPGRDTVLPLDLRQSLVLQARDDHGLRAVELVAYRVTSLGERQEPVRQRMEVAGSRSAVARPLLDVSTWGLLPGDTVRYHARVLDNRPSGGGAVGQETRTREFVLRMPGAAEMRRSAQERLEDVSKQMERLAEEAARAAQESREMERQLAASRERDAEVGSPFREGREAGTESADFQQREDVQRALDRQSEMDARVDSLARQLEELSEAMREAGLREPGLREDLQELQELMEEIASAEMRERLEETARDMGSTDPRQAQEAMRRLTEEQEAFRERLEESLERFRRAAVEQDFRATTAEAEELAQEERALADAMREDADPRPRADQQAELEERAEEMEARMERLEQRLQQLGEEDAAREVREARQRSGEARESMDEAARQARQQEGEQAGEQADQAADGMQQAMEQLQQAQQQMAQQQSEAVRQALRQAAEDALSMARRQGELRQEMRGADGERMGELRGDVAAVQQGVRNMADNLSVTMQSAGGGDRELSTRMGEAMEALQRTVDAMESRSGATASPAAAAEAAVEALNQVALMAMAGAQQAGEEGQGQGQGQGSQEVQEQMESLAQEQGSLNNQAGQMMPMQLGQEALRQQLQQLAQGQQSVSQGLQDLADQPGSEGETLGDLQALAEEAAALAEELAGGRLDPETRERQERLFHRLLDAGRSLEKDEESEERESASPGAFDRRPVLPLSPEALNALRFRLPPAEVLRRLTPAERQLVIQYFERLNRGEGGGTRAPDPGAPRTPDPGGARPEGRP